MSVVKKVTFKFESARCKVHANLLSLPPAPELPASEAPAAAELELPDPFHSPLGSEVPMGYISYLFVGQMFQTDSPLQAAHFQVRGQNDYFRPGLQRRDYRTRAR